LGNFLKNIYLVKNGQKWPFWGPFWGPPKIPLFRGPLCTESGVAATLPLHIFAFWPPWGPFWPLFGASRGGGRGDPHFGVPNFYFQKNHFFFKFFTNFTFFTFFTFFLNFGPAKNICWSTKFFLDHQKFFGRELFFFKNFIFYKIFFFLKNNFFYKFYIFTNFLLNFVIFYDLKFFIFMKHVYFFNKKNMFINMKKWSFFGVF